MEVNRLLITRIMFVAVFSLLLGACTKQDDQAREKAHISADESRPNIVLISIDTLRPDHLGCYGYSRNTSPHIDQLAAEGALFENAISSTSWTLPAHCALFTGLADTVHGCVEMDRRLADSRVTLAERLQDIGYATVGFFSGPALHPIFGLSQGFDKYVDCTSYAQLSMQVTSTGQTLDGGVIESRAVADITSPRIYEQVRHWLNNQPRRPFFMFIHMWDVHFDFIPPPPYDNMFDPDYDGPVSGELFFLDPAINRDMPRRDLEHIIALYDGEIAWTDEHVGKILAELDRLNPRDSTIVILVSDHGEEFFEHGRKGHRQTLYDEVIRIPLIVRYPGHIPPGRRYRQQAGIIDVVPTLLELLGLPAANDAMGRSLTPLFTGGKTQQQPLDRVVVSELFSVGRELRSYRRLEGKLIHNQQTDSTQIFDLRTDPGEQSALRDVTGPLARRLQDDQQQALKWLTEFRTAFPAAIVPPQLPDHVRQQLETLGYLGGEADEEEEQTEP